jgi:hypothetical protein
MRKTVSALLIATLPLAACSTNLNPFNWFGESRSVPVASVNPNANPLLPEEDSIFSSRRNAQALYTGTPIETVSTLTIDRVPGGAIIRATGIAAVQGVYDAQLTPANPDEEAEDGVLTYRLEGVRPANPTAVGSPATRQITVARHVNDSLLVGVRTIRVEAVQNAREAGR